MGVGLDYTSKYREPYCPKPHIQPGSLQLFVKIRIVYDRVLLALALARLLQY